MRLGEILIERKLITNEDLERALELQKERGDKLGKTLVDMGFVAMRDVLAALADQLDIPLVTIEGPPAVSTETEMLSPRFLRQFRCLPVSRDDHNDVFMLEPASDEGTRLLDIVRRVSPPDVSLRIDGHEVVMLDRTAHTPTQARKR